MNLKEYKAKRKFSQTPEPVGSVKKKNEGALKFFVQKHHASHLHYDFRLEMEGVLKSWAIPKGPSMNPEDKRLAMMVEDHPIEYGNFEGIIPKGNYGAGTVMLWDEGEYSFPGIKGRKENEKKLFEGLRAGNLKLFLNGNKLKGEFALVKIKREKENEWLLIKKNDEFASKGKVTDQDKSILSGRDLEEIKIESENIWRSPKISEKEIEITGGAVRKKMPEQVKPMMATLVNEAFDSEDWLFEIKWDGYRAIANLNYNEVELYSRNLLSFNEAFPEIVNALKELGIQAIVDGEICAVDEKGNPHFELIQNYRRHKEGILFYIFDIIHWKDYDLSAVPLIGRKNLLRKIIPEDHPVIRYSDHVIARGKAFMQASKKQNLEGIIAKRINSVYLAGIRGKDWLKIKNLCEQEAVIAGFTEPRGGRKKFGALILGVYNKEGKLEYIGHTGGGFNDSSLKDIHSKMENLVEKKSPFETPPKTNMPVTWIKPELVCEVKFQEWTKEGIMRQPVFLGLRVDKSPKDVKREIGEPLKAIKKENEKTEKYPKVKSKTKESNGKNEGENKKKRKYSAKDEKNRKRSHRPAIPGKNFNQAMNDAKELLSESKKLKKSERDALQKSQGMIKEEKKGKSSLLENLFQENDYVNEDKTEAEKIISGKTLRFTNLKKLYWKEDGISKEDLLTYYHRISDFILPYLKDRPQNLRRNPNGYNSPGFFQKDMPSTIPDWVETKAIYSETNDKDINYLIARDEASLLFMVNLGCIEINPWLSRESHLQYPDYVVIDLDPQDVSFDQVVEVAQAVKEVLDMGKISGYCKTSGSKGLHIYIPLGARYDYEQAKVFAEIIAQLTHQLVPEITSLERMPKKRKNKIYLDYLQNRIGQTLAAPYCVRPRLGTTVSTPIEWDEIKEGLHPSHFNFFNIFERLKKKGDLFAPVIGKGVDMKKALENLGWI